MRLPKVRDKEATQHQCEVCREIAGYILGQNPSHYVCVGHYISFHKFIDRHSKDATYLGKYGMDWWEELYSQWLKTYGG